jgi:hypothetical protein
MSSPELREVDNSTPVKEVVIGYLSAAAIFAGIACLFWIPMRIGPVAMAIALLAATMASGKRRIANWAVGVATFGWLAGMTVSVVLSRDLF